MAQFEEMTTQTTAFSPMEPKPSTTSSSKLLWGGIVLMVMVGVGLLWWLNRGDWIYPTQPNASQVLDAALTPDSTIGQTIVARQSGLQGVGIKLQHPEALRGQQFTLSVYDAPTEDAKLLRRTTVTVSDISEGEYLYFKFLPLPNSRHQYYYFTLQTSDDVQARLYADVLSRYVDGAAYENGVPVDAQLAFHLNYNRWLMVVNLIQRILSGIPAGLASLILLFVPGGVVLLWLRPQLTLDPIEWGAVAVGISLGIIPVAMQWLRFSPVVLSSPIVWGVYGTLTIWLIVEIRRKLWRGMPALKQALYSSITTPTVLTFVGILLLSLIVRLQVVRGVDIPLWADSYHHTVISQLIVDNGRIVTNWEPYAPLKSLNYHFGFHTMVAIFHWLTGLNVPKSVIFFGQILNTAAVLMAYLLGRRFGGNAWVGVFAALITGLLSKYPMYYVNWGRYTQLAGQILLPVLMVLTWELLRRNKFDARLTLVGGTVTAGLMLTHYRVILFFGAFLLAATVVHWAISRWQLKTITPNVISLAAMGALSVLIAASRIIELVGSRLWVVSETIATNGSNITYINKIHNAMGNLFEVLPPWVVLSGWAGLMLGGWARKRGIIILGGWWIGLLLIANPLFLGLPGTGVVTNFAIFIATYLIFSVLSGEFLARVFKLGEGRVSVVSWVALVMILAVTLFGSTRQLRIIQRQNVLVTSADLRAIHWLKENVPSSAKFVVNNRMAYGETSVVATDAGWWIPYLTGRETFVPPMVYNSERANPAYVATIHNLSRISQQLNTRPVATASALMQQGFNYVYIGQQRGGVWQEDASPIDPAKLETTLAPKLLYAQDGVRIYELW